MPSSPAAQQFGAQPSPTRKSGAPKISGPEFRQGRRVTEAQVRKRPRNLGDPRNVELRRHTDGRLMGLRTDRYSWWVHWRELADFLLPRRYKWLITPNQATRGSPINQHIIDSTGTIAARDLSAGLHGGITNPTRQWLKMKVGYHNNDTPTEEGRWLAEVIRILMLIFSQSNFYTSCATVYFDIVIFGSACCLIYEDYENVITCVNPCLGEFYFAVNSNYEVDTVYREFVLTIKQIVEEFGYDNCSPSVQGLYDTGQGSLHREKLIAHAIEPNDDRRGYSVPRHFKWREVYWEWGQGQQFILRQQGFHEFPGGCPRWSTVSNDAYGRGPGMDSLTDVKQLQQESRRKAQGIDKQVNPPLVADAQLKNQPASLLPGGITYVVGMSAGKGVGMAPVYTVMPDIRGMVEDLAEVRARIKDIFFTGLMKMISQFEPKSNISATEIDARRGEQMVLIGEVLTRFDKEFLMPAVTRVYNIAMRAGLFPPAPASIQGQPVEVMFDSMLHEAIRANKAGGIERMLQTLGSIMGEDPQVMDNIDIDKAVAKLAIGFGVDPDIIRLPAELVQIRAQRQKQAQQQQQMQNAMAAAQGAKNLAGADIGGGKNALQAVMGQQ